MDDSLWRLQITMDDWGWFQAMQVLHRSGTLQSPAHYMTEGIFASYRVLTAWVQYLKKTKRTSTCLKNTEKKIEKDGSVEGWGINRGKGGYGSVNRKPCIK